jgi:trimethylamine:corrinoid methyltransferase-like protein
MFAQTGLRGDFLKLRETRALFRNEQHFPSDVIERGGSATTSPDILSRARTRVNELLEQHQRPTIAGDREQALELFAEREAHKVGLDSLPGIHSASSV